MHGERTVLHLLLLLLCTLSSAFSTLQPVLLLLLQVLESTIQYQDQVAAFKRAMQAQLQPDGPEEPDQTDPQHSDLDVQLQASTSYVVSLIYKANPALVQQVLDWEAADWHTWLAAAAYRVCLLLQLTERGSQATDSAPAYVCTAEQDLNKVGPARWPAHLLALELPPQLMSALTVSPDRWWCCQQELNKQFVLLWHVPACRLLTTS